MPAGQINITLGTAGHIDHGKTALVKCLTGCDTDTLKIEKERGMSIELGFAPCIVSGTEVGIVDVPGHESFIKTMVAGAAGIDGVIFVIAADDGVMPQTREHLDILTLLGLRHGFVVLTKTDCVTEERLRTAAEEIRSFVQGTFLEGSPVIPVSNITGQGFDTLTDALKVLVAAIRPKPVDGVFRLPVERVFSVKGYGTVVTGIPVSGSVRTGDEVMLLPQGARGKVRAIQVFKRSGDVAVCGQCTAMNVPQWDHRVIRRGDVVTLDGFFSSQQWFLCELEVLKGAPCVVKNAAAMKFHTGTSEASAAVYVMEGNSLGAGERGLVQVRVSEPIVAGPRDRFILRAVSPSQTVGGGMIVEPVARKLKRSSCEVINDCAKRAKAVLNNADFAEYCIKAAPGIAASARELEFRTKLLPVQLETILDELVRAGRIVRLASGGYIHRDTLAEVQDKVTRVVGQFHKDEPARPGIEAQQLCRSSGLEREVFADVISMLVSKGLIVERKDCLALANHRETFSDAQQKALADIESFFKDRPFNPPAIEELAELMHLPASTRPRQVGRGGPIERVREIVRILAEQERLIRVEGDIFFHREAVEQARLRLVEYIRSQGKLESVKFKYVLDTTRKFALPLLDYFDRAGVTRRDGYTRYLRNTS